jgi:anti-anti-sigma factor
MGLAPVRGRQHDLTSGVVSASRYEVVMPQLPVIASRAPASHYAAPPFVCTYKAAPSAAWVHVAGELDLATSPELDRVLREAELDSQLLVLDLRELTFIDVSATRVILAADGRARRGARRLMIARGPAQVDRVFTLTGARERLSMFDLDADEPALLGIA